MARVVLPQSKLRARRRKRRARVALWTLLSVLSCLSIFIGLSWLPQIRISTVEVVGADVVSTENIQHAAQEVLRGTYFFVIPKNNIFIYPKSDIITHLQTAFPSLQKTSIRANFTTGGFHTIIVTVLPRTPKALWCGEVLASSTPCAFIDEQGVVYADAVEFSGTVYEHYYGALSPITSNLQASYPKQFLTPQEFHSLRALISQIAQNTEAVVSVATDNVGDARVGFISGFTLIFSLKDDAGDIYQRFVLALQAEAFKGQPLSHFLYLDLRFGDKLYYKVKNQ